MKKTIHAIVKYFYPVAAGIETNMLETYSILAKKGWDVTVYTTRDTLTERDCLSNFEKIRGLKIKRYPRLRYLLSGYRWTNADLICLHNFDVLPHMIILIYSLILKMIGKKTFAIIVTPHGGYTPEWSIFNPVFSLVKQIYHFTLGTILTNSVVDGMRAVSEWECQEIVKHSIKPKIVNVISNGIESDAYLDVDRLASQDIKQTVKNLGKYLIQIGRIHPIKNYETTIRALLKIPSDVNFVIVGPTQNSDSYLSNLKKLAKDLGVSDRIIFLGVVRGVDKYYLIKHAQIMVHMALWESFCNVVHEGMSQGLPCIVANNTALPLLVRNGINGYCVKTTDTKALAEKINFILKNKNTYEIKKMQDKNRFFGLQDSWQNVADRMDQWFKNNLIQLKII